MFTYCDNIFSSFYILKIDGDPDSASVQREFERVVKQYIDKLSGDNGKAQMNGDAHPKIISGLYNRNISTDPPKSFRQNHHNNDTMPGVIPTSHSYIPTISNHVSKQSSLANGHLGQNNRNNQKYANAPRTTTNGYIPNGRPNLRAMLQDAEIDSHI